MAERVRPGRRLLHAVPVMILAGLAGAALVSATAVVLADMETGPCVPGISPPQSPGLSPPQSPGVSPPVSPGVSPPVSPPSCPPCPPVSPGVSPPQSPGVSPPVSPPVCPPTNTAPIARDDGAVTDVGTPVDIDVLANDSDADGDTLAITAVSAPAHGAAAIEGDEIRYTPAAGFTGSDSFGYTVDDGAGGQATATVVVAVNMRRLLLEDVAVREGETASLRVRLSSPSPTVVLVPYVTLPRTALPILDFVPRAGVLVFPPGVTELAISVRTVDNRAREAREELVVALVGLGAVAPVDRAPVVTIIDND